MQEDGETEVQAMLRVQQAGPQLWRRTRAALLQLRGRIHARAVTCAQEVVAHADALASTGHPGPVAGEQSNLDQERIKACFSMTV